MYSYYLYTRTRTLNFHSRTRESTYTSIRYVRGILVYVYYPYIILVLPQLFVLEENDKSFSLHRMRIGKLCSALLYFIRIFVQPRLFSFANRGRTKAFFSFLKSRKNLLQNARTIIKLVKIFFFPSPSLFAKCFSLHILTLIKFFAVFFFVRSSVFKRRIIFFFSNLAALYSSSVAVWKKQTVPFFALSSVVGFYIV